MGVFCCFVGDPTAEVNLPGEKTGMERGFVTLRCLVEVEGLQTLAPY